MVVDPANVASLYAPGKTQDISTDNIRSSERRDDVPQPENGRTSEIGPAVVADLSAAALETSRAVAQGSQAADQNRVYNRERAEEQAVFSQAENGRKELDLMV